jgi:hypothetical protein
MLENVAKTVLREQQELIAVATVSSPSSQTEPGTCWSQGTTYGSTPGLMRQRPQEPYHLDVMEGVVKDPGNGSIERTKEGASPFSLVAGCPEGSGRDFLSLCFHMFKVQVL